jgi:16S rRNA (cytosine1402-N4)-methyltransferase
MAPVGQDWKLVQTSFGKITDACQRLGERTFDGILLDLGISSYQLDDPSRGISFRLDGPLDMRLDPSRGAPAHELVNSLREPELRRIIDTYGEERQAARIAAAIVRERQRGMILTTGQLREVVLTVARPPHETKSLARVFQALRIAVNRELEELESVLPQARDLLRPGGRLAVIAYHSLEDRIVKRFFQTEAKGRCTCPPALPVCVCGARATLALVNRKPILPAAPEVEANPRARSARLRVAEKVA